MSNITSKNESAANASKLVPIVARKPIDVALATISAGLSVPGLWKNQETTPAATATATDE